MPISVVGHNKTMLNYIFENHCDACTYTNRSSLVFLRLPSMVFFSVSPTFAVTKYPTPIFILPRFASLLSFIIVTTGKLMIDFEGGGGHRWELPGNYPVFTVVMVIYHYVERIWRILVTPILIYNIYDH